MRTDILSTSSASALVRPTASTATPSTSSTSAAQSGLGAAGAGGVADSGGAKSNNASSTAYARDAIIQVNPFNKADPTLPTDASDPADPADATTAPDAAALKQSVENLNQYAQPREGSIEFSLDDSTGKTLLKVVDKETNTVLLQVPSKQALALSQSIGLTTGLLIKDSA